METVIPRRGFFRYLNPSPFNKKENAFIVISQYFLSLPELFKLTAKIYSGQPGCPLRPRD